MNCSYSVAKSSSAEKTWWGWKAARLGGRIAFVYYIELWKTPCGSAVKVDTSNGLGLSAMGHAGAIAGLCKLRTRLWLRAYGCCGF